MIYFLYCLKYLLHNLFLNYWILVVANTAKLYVSVEKEDDTVYKNDGTKTVITTEGDSTNDANTSKNKDHTYAIKNIDFGLVERPETRVNVRKEIEQIKLLKEDGEEPILLKSCHSLLSVDLPDKYCVSLDIFWSSLGSVSFIWNSGFFAPTWYVVFL